MPLLGRLMSELKYNRVLLKLSGESFCKPGVFGIDGDALKSIAERIAEICRLGPEVAGVVEWIAGFASIATGVAVLLVLSATGWRVVRARIQAAGHAEAAQASSAGAERSDPVHDVTPSVHDPVIQPRTA